jgi:hypothetical protein
VSSPGLQPTAAVSRIDDFQLFSLRSLSFDFGYFFSAFFARTFPFFPIRTAWPIRVNRYFDVR